MGISYQNIALIVLILSTIALVVLLIRMRRRGVGTCKLTEDPTGFWRYHKETQFQKKVAFEKKLSKGKESSKDSEPGEEGKEEEKKAIAVLTFQGDIRARQHNVFAKLVDEIEVNKDKLSEVVVVINSSGGMVSQYGHAFSQMQRLRDTGVEVTVCIDVVAASGGYLMSLPASKIIAAPFSVIGSVGVVAYVPNIRNLLTSWKIQPRTFTAGAYKRTVSLTDEDSSEDIARFQSQLESIHRLFLAAVKNYRPQANLEAVETAAHWTAAESMEQQLGLVDEIGTSQEYILKQNRKHDVVLMTQKRGWFEDGVGLFSAKVFDEIESRVVALCRGW